MGGRRIHLAPSQKFNRYSAYDYDGEKNRSISSTDNDFCFNEITFAYDLFRSTRPTGTETKHAPPANWPHPTSLWYTLYTCRLRTLTPQWHDTVSRTMRVLYTRARCTVVVIVLYYYYYNYLYYYVLSTRCESPWPGLISPGAPAAARASNSTSK